MAKTHADTFFAQVPNIPLYEDCPNKSYPASLTADMIIDMARPHDSYHMYVVPNAKYTIAITTFIEGKQTPVMMIYNGPRGKLIASSSGSILSNMYPHCLATKVNWMNSVHGPGWRDVVQPSEWKKHHGLVVEEAFLTKAAIALNEYRKTGKVEEHNELLKKYMEVHYACVRAVRGIDSGKDIGKTVKKFGRSVPYAAFGKEWETRKLYHVAALQVEMYYHNPEFLNHLVDEDYTFAELATFENGEWGYKYEFQNINLETFNETDLEGMLEVVFGYTPEKYTTLLDACKTNEERDVLARKSFSKMVINNEINCSEIIQDRTKWTKGIQGYPGNTHIQRVLVNLLRDCAVEERQQKLIDFTVSLKPFWIIKPELAAMTVTPSTNDDLEEGELPMKRKASD